MILIERLKCFWRGRHELVWYGFYGEPFGKCTRCEKIVEVKR